MSLTFACFVIYCNILVSVSISVITYADRGSTFDGPAAVATPASGIGISYEQNWNPGTQLAVEQKLGYAVVSDAWDLI